MAFVLRDGISYSSTNDFIGQATNGLDATLLAAGWERSTKGQQLSGALGATDRVYYSSGENGREAIFLRVTQTTANDIDFRAYSFWNPAGSAGFNGVGDAAGATRLTGQGAAYVAWIAANKDGVAIVFRIGGVYRVAYCGLITRQVAPQYSGQTTISNGGAGAVAGQPNVKVVSVTNLTAGQDIWIVNQNATGGANVERKTIQSIDSGTSTITLTANLVNSYADGALVALDPQPVILWCSGGGNTWAAGNRYMLHHADAYPGGLLATVSQTTMLDQLTAGAFNDYNPDDFAQNPLENFLIYDATAGRKMLRGYLSRFVRAMKNAAFVDEGIVDVGSDEFMLLTQNDASWVALKKTA